jgi:hypothetical protein
MSDLLPGVYLFFWLLVGHALCDLPLQPGRLSVKKRAPGLLGAWALCAHGLIHGGAVALATGSVPIGIAETVLHASIDKLKCKDVIGLGTDQVLHVCCKLLWVAIVFLWV